MSPNCANNCFPRGDPYHIDVGAAVERNSVSGVSMPVSRPTGRALVVGVDESARRQPVATLHELGFASTESGDPYSAMAELCRRPLVYRAVIFSLAGLYKDELPVISAIKRRFAHVEVWLTHTDGRQGAMAEAMRLGADGLLGEDGLHRIALAGNAEAPAGPAQPMVSNAVEHVEPSPEPMDSHGVGEPLLTAAELTALLHETAKPTDSGPEDTWNEDLRDSRE